MEGNVMGRMVSYVGAGGKTSSILEEVVRLYQMRKRVIVTTTTHMKQPERIPEGTNRLTECAEEAANLLENGGIVWYGHPCAENKFKGPLPDEWEILCRLAEVVLVEADGSKRLPVKVPADFEPVIPDKTSKIIVVMGLSGLGKPIGKVCHRLPLVLALLKKQESELLAEEDYVRILWKGYLEPLQKKFPDCEWEVYLNQVKSPQLFQAAEQIKRRLYQIDGLKDCPVRMVDYERALEKPEV